MRDAECRKPKWYLAFSASAAGRACRAQLYRQMFNKSLYLLAYGNVYPNRVAMTPGACGETADGISEAKIDDIIEQPRLQPTLHCRQLTGRVRAGRS
jgi:hypothetical protein